MTAPDVWLLSRRWPVARPAFIVLFWIYLGYLAAPTRAGLFGISVPANYGTWFTNIHQLYLSHQDLVANARALYTAYLAVSSALDALEGMNAADQQAFRARWRRNLQVMLEAQVWFEIDAAATGGDRSVNQLVQQLLGLRLDGEGRAAVDPASIRTLALSLTADRQRWAQALAGAPPPRLPEWLATEADRRRITREFVERPVALAFESYRARLAEAATQRFFDAVRQNPLAYVECSGRAPCWSPFNLGASAAPARDWPEMLALMYDRGHPLHAPLPLPEERAGDGAALDVAQYLHRRVCAALWRTLGMALRDKLARFHALFQRRCRDLQVAVRDIQFLVRFLQDSVTPLSEWPTGDASALALVAATAMSVNAGGLAKAQGRMRSWVDGYLAKKAAIALDRAREVKERVKALDALFADLLAQIDAVRKQSQPDEGLDGLVLDGDMGRTLQSLTVNAAPPHAYLSSTAAMERLSARIAAACGLGRRS